MDKQLIISAGQQLGDPYSHLYFEKDMENGGVGEVSFYDNELKTQFEWDRRKSNETLSSKGFSFYYARRVFGDREAVIDDYRNNPNTNENRTLLIGKPFKDKGIDLMVVVFLEFINQGYRIISSYPTTNSRYESLYESSIRQHQIADSAFKRRTEYLNSLYLK